MKFKGYIIEKYQFNYTVQSLRGPLAKSEERWRVVDSVTKEEVSGAHYTSKSAKSVVIGLMKKKEEVK